MKGTIFLSLFLLVFCFKSSIQAASIFSDTIWVKLQNGVLLQFVGNDLDHNFPVNMDLSYSLNHFLVAWETMNGRESSSTNKMEISMERNNRSIQISITESQPSRETYLLAPEDSFKFSVPRSNTLFLAIHKTQVRLYFSEVKQIREAEKILKGNFFRLLKENIQSSKSIYPLNRWYVYTSSGELYLVHAEKSGSNQNDLLLVGLGTDVQLIKGMWTPGFSGSISIVFCRKLIQKNKYSILYDGVYDFSSNNGRILNQINHFIGIGYSHNYAETPAYKTWYGFSLSYLVKNGGMLFEKNTYSIALIKNINNHLDLQPELYFTDFFKNIYPSIKMSVHF